jgi:hypothetical protein
MELYGHQGDVCFYKVKSIPRSAVEGTDKQCVERALAYGEFSGHAHQVLTEDRAKVKFFRNANEPHLIYLEVLERIGIRHGRTEGFGGVETDNDYHNVVHLDPGTYATGIVVETDWLSKTIRKVVD